MAIAGFSPHRQQFPSSFHRMKTSCGLYSSLKMSSRQHERVRWRYREKHRAREEKETKACKKNSAACCKTLWKVFCCNNSMATTNHWFWKISWIRLKSLIRHLCDYWYCPSLLHVVAVILDSVSLVLLCKYWFFHIRSHMFLKYVNWTNVSNRTGILKNALVVRPNKCIYSGL